MNILPKKRWHVRTRENIARVRRDEAAATEDEKAQKARARKAETEARINLLREKANARHEGQKEIIQNHKIRVEAKKLEHVNFFTDLEKGRIDHHAPNEDHETEIKVKKEKYEQQIGYLTYLGRNVNVESSSINWYDELPRRLIDKEGNREIQKCKKLMADPLTDIKRYIRIMSSNDSKTQTNILTSENSKKQKFKIDHNNDKIKQSKQSKTISIINIEKLRQKRLAREQTEKLRTDALLSKLRSESISLSKTDASKGTIRQKYNSQFYPEIARQNIEIRK